MTIPERTSILIIGGGPCGLTLANELGRRGADAVLVDEEDGTTFNPQANATQARTMEHYRRLGFVEEIRQAGLPVDYPTDVAYFTRFFGYELARKKQPSSARAASLIKEQEVAWSAAEPPHRVSQKYVEQILRSHAETLPGIQLNYGWRLIDFEDHGTGGITAKIQRTGSEEVRTIHTQFLVGADGPRSIVREKLGIRYGGGEDQKRDFMGGSMFAVYVRSAEFLKRFPHPPAWMHESFNTDRRAFMAAVNGIDEYAFHTQLREGEKQDHLTEEDARRAFQSACGEAIPCEVLSFMTWKAGHTLVAERMQHGNIFIAGDASHLFTPTGGLGYNTAIEDAVNLGWKLASVVKGLGGSKLLDSYEMERRPVAIRNTNFARHFADSLGNYKAASGIEEDSPQGEAARREAGEYLDRHAWAEFNIPGITFGYRYDGSSVIIGDGTQPPEDAINTYKPTACPGGRAPHAWLDDGTSLFDHFGFEWTILDFSSDSTASAGFRTAAASLGLELKVLDEPKTLRGELYHAALTLIRPDQIVAWRGETQDAGQAIHILNRVLGNDGASVST